MEVVSRKKYADELEAWIGKGLVVVLTGQRRVGKSCLLKDFIQRHENDIESNLIYIDKEKKNFNFIKTDEQLNDYIDSQLLSDKHNYILIDEVQNILRWERSIRSYITEENIDIIISYKLMYFYICSVFRAKSHRPVKHKLHITCSACLFGCK